LCARKARWPSYRGIEAGVPSLRPAYKGRASASSRTAAARAGGPAVRPFPRSALRSFRSGPVPPRSSSRPIQPTGAARAPFQTGNSPEQRPPRPCSRCTAGRAAAGSSLPISGHKSTAGEPLVLPHSFLGQGRHRRGPIPVSCAALHTQGLHCISLVLFRVFFVNQGPIHDRNRNSRDPGAKVDLQ
jgi:hypothetical protein